MDLDFWPELLLWNKKAYSADSGLHFHKVGTLTRHIKKGTSRDWCVQGLSIWAIICLCKVELHETQDPALPTMQPSHQILSLVSFHVSQKPQLQLVTGFLLKRWRQPCWHHRSCFLQKNTFDTTAFTGWVILTTRWPMCVNMDHRLISEESDVNIHNNWRKNRAINTIWE